FGFFFSSRRRHTRSKRDWSSDVCSSDLICSHTDALENCAPSPFGDLVASPSHGKYHTRGHASISDVHHQMEINSIDDWQAPIRRSEERRVGKEYRSRWGQEYATKEMNST